MTETTLVSLVHHLQQHYQDGEYALALKLATQALDVFPEQHTMLDYWRMSMAARSGDEAQALEIMQNALDRGDWYSEMLLRRSPAFSTLQGDPRFERLVVTNQSIAEMDHEGEFPLITLRAQHRCLDADDPCPLLIGLHRNSATVQTSLPFWTMPAAAGWLVAAPHSSQAVWKGAYVWDNREQAESEVLQHLGRLQETYAVDVLRTILAGHALGGDLAVWMALRGSIRVSGFLAIGPDGPFIDEPDEWENLIAGAPQELLRGAIIYGKEDAAISHDHIRRLVENLKRAGIACHLEAVPDAALEYSPDYNSAVRRAMEFLIADPGE